MRNTLYVVLLTAFVNTQNVGAAEGEHPAQEGSNAVSLAHILERAAVRLNKNFIVDPRVRADVTMYGIDPERLTYGELQSVLSVYGFVASQESNGTIEIVPDANARQLPMPVITGRGANVGEDEFVTKLVDVGSLQAAQLVPVLRPLLPQYAHLVADVQTNTLLVVARHSNVKQIESIVSDLKKRPAAVVAPKAASSTD